MLLLAAATAGCAGLLPRPGSGPGLPDGERDLRRQLASGRYEAALDRLNSDASPVRDELLRLQFRGLAAHYAGRPGASSSALEAAATLAEERYTRSLSRGALAFLTNHRILPYRPGDVERLLLHHYGALNYLAAGDPEEAAVEARRLAHMLDRTADDGPAWARTPAGRSLRATLRRLTGAVFEAAGERNDADVARRLARRLESEPGTGTEPVGADPEGRRDSAAPGEGRPGSGGRVVLVVEQGFAPHRVERSLNAVLGVEQVRRLRTEARQLRSTGGDAEGDSAVGGEGPDGGAADSADVSLSLARQLLDGGRRSGRRGRVRLAEDGDGSVRVLRLAWPELAQPVSARPVRRVEAPGVAGDSARVRSTGADLAGALAAEFRSGRVERLARTLLRAAAKQTAVEALADGVKEGDEEWGEAVGTAASIFAAVVERADTRCWHLLPARISVHRLDLPPGEHRLELLLAGPGPAADRRVSLGPVHVREGGTTVLSHRVWPRRSELAARGP